MNIVDFSDDSLHKCILLTSYLDDDVLPPVVEEILDVPHHGGVGPVVAVGHLKKSL